MNRIFALLIMIALGAGFASCSESNSEPKSQGNDEVSINQEADEPIKFEGDEQEEPTAATNPADGKVRKINTQEFINEIFDYKSSPTKWVYKGDKPAVIDFYADWCGPCKRVAPIMDELAKEYAGKMYFYKINTDEERELAGAVFGIRSIPSILFIPAQGQPMMYTGAFPKQEYVKLINEKLNVK
jgi:thioredoxin